MEQLKRAYWFTFWIKDNGPSKGESITFTNNMSLRRAYSLFYSNLRSYRIGGSGPDSRPAGIKDVYWTLNEVYCDPEGILTISHQKKLMKDLVKLVSSLISLRG
ncbi:hypothetical protein EDC32_101565 [Laceyella sacchari]|jgi:hypothetical protein|nr:hypothetical protein EDC32_101565 [Laceyella sacchari]